MYEQIEKFLNPGFFDKTDEFILNLSSGTPGLSLFHLLLTD